MIVEKNKEYIVDIIDNGYEGEGIAKIDDFTIFIPKAIKGEKVKILIVKVLSSHAFGKIVEFIKKSDARQDSDCITYKRCGGCNLRHIKYEETLHIKQNIVQNLVNKNLNSKIQVDTIVGMQNPIHYRNKAQYPVGLNKNNEPIIGVFANRTHEVVPIQGCLINDYRAEKISKCILEFIKENKISIYNEQTQKGLFRHIVIKVGIKTKQIMCIFVINGKIIPMEQKLIYKITEEFPEIKTIVKNINMNKTNVILGQENIVLYGKGYIEDILGNYTFKIFPLSFYQVNPIQAEKMYNLSIKLADISKEDIIFDLYCGIGTISLFMAKHAKKVYGIEIVKEAVDAAIENARINGIKNAEFFAGDVEYLLDDLINVKNIKADVVVFDPPRKGLDIHSIRNILKIKPKKIVYISCNPATLMRDLKEFEEVYNIKNITPIDMFPFTHHVEVCVLLELKDCQLS